jgi:hypothetical protein
MAGKVGEVAQLMDGFGFRCLAHQSAPQIAFLLTQNLAGNREPRRVDVLSLRWEHERSGDRFVSDLAGLVSKDAARRKRRWPFSIMLGEEVYTTPNEEVV